MLEMGCRMSLVHCGNDKITSDMDGTLEGGAFLQCLAAGLKKLELSWFFFLIVLAPYSLTKEYTVGIENQEIVQ